MGRIEKRVGIVQRGLQQVYRTSASGLTKGGQGVVDPGVALEKTYGRAQGRWIEIPEHALGMELGARQQALDQSGLERP